MAQVTITNLPQAQALTGFESVPIVQNGVTVQTTTGAISAQPNLQYTFLTATQQPGLANSRYMAVGSGLQIIDGGAQGTLQINMTGAAASLNASANGIQVKTAIGTLTARAITVGTGLSITNGDGVAGNPLIGLGTFLSNFQSMSGSTGLIGVNGGTISALSIAGTANQISITNPDGSTGNPTIGIATNAIVPGTGSLGIPAGTSVQRVGGAGSIRYNTNLQLFEGYTSTGWTPFAVGTVGVTSFSAGTTGFTPNTDTTGAITLAGTLKPSNGGTGATTLTGYVYGNGTSTMTASATIPTTALSGTITNAQLANSAITINGSSVSLGGSITVTATASNALTIGTGLTGTSYNGSAPVTITIDSTVATLTGTQTLTNKTISGSNNTLSNIGNSSLTNSSVTIGSTSISLGSTSTSLAGISQITFAGAVSGTSTLQASPAAGSAISILPNVAGVLVNTGGTGVVSNTMLANSSLTIGTTSISLGNTSLTLGGLTSVTVTQDPTTSLQLATKQYVDNVAQGLSTKAPVACATTANITLSGEQTIDGVTTSSSRVLVKNQSTSSQNGIYVSAAGAWTRSTDADTWTELVSAYTWVQQGTINGDTGWVCTVDPGGTIGVTAVTWVQFAGAGSYTAGTGLTLTGTQFSLTSPVVASLGGTGVTTLTGLAYGNGTSAFTAATAAQVVSVIGTTAVTNATNAVNTNITAVTTGATNYLTFVTSTSGNLPQLVNSSITANAVNGTITGGIAGGAF